MCPAPIGVVGELIRGAAFYWGQMAGALFGSTSVALIYYFFVKYHVAGADRDAVKG